MVEALKRIEPDAELFGIGGNLMKKAGMHLLYHINKMAFLGFVEVIRHLPFIKKVQRDILGLVEKEQIATALLIDYPGFNLSIAKKLKKRGVKIVYYISPQVWAWHTSRVKKIKRLVDKMLVVFPFEVDFYREHGVNAEFVGHPLVERLEAKTFRSREEYFAENGLDPAKEILLVQPGSRNHEVEKIFPEAIEAAVKLAEDFGMQVVVGCAPTIDEAVFDEYRQRYEFILLKTGSFELMHHAKFGIIKSGTSTLEAALSGLPMLVVYKASALTYHFIRRVIKVKAIGMVNILAGEMVAPELLQHDCNAEAIYNTAAAFLHDETKYAEARGKLQRIREKLGAGEAASKQSAEIISAYM